MERISYNPTQLDNIPEGVLVELTDAYDAPIMHVIRDPFTHKIERIHTYADYIAHRATAKDFYGQFLTPEIKRDLLQGCPLITSDIDRKKAYLAGVEVTPEWLSQFETFCKRQLL
jgi:hypothetical protein